MVKKGNKRSVSESEKVDQLSSKLSTNVVKKKMTYKNKKFKVDKNSSQVHEINSAKLKSKPVATKLKDTKVLIGSKKIASNVASEQIEKNKKRKKKMVPLEQQVSKVVKKQNETSNVSQNSQKQVQVKQKVNKNIKIDSPKGQHKKMLNRVVTQKKMSADELKKLITEVQSRETITKTAKRRLGRLKKLLHAAEEGNEQVKNSPTQETKITEVTGKSKRKTAVITQNFETSEKTKKSKNLKKQKVIEQSEGNDSLSTSQEGNEIEEDETDDEDDNDASDSNDDADANNEVEPKIQPNPKKQRYVLFVGNLPFQATVEDIKNHFLRKIDNIVNIRYPTKRDSNEPRGIAYVEVANSVDFEKGLMLHHTMLSGRRINVEYTATGSKFAGKQKVKAKNLKLRALHKAGKLAGGIRKGQRKQNLKKNRKAV